jgi:hypothetical protein
VRKALRIEVDGNVVCPDFRVSAKLGLTSIDMGVEGWQLAERFGHVGVKTVPGTPPSVFCHA